MNTQVEQKIKDLIIKLKREAEQCNQWLIDYSCSYDNEARIEVHVRRVVLKRMVKELNELITTN